MPKKQNYKVSVGKRRTATARVRLFSGKGESIVNDKPIEKYFPGPLNTSLWTKPFRITDTLEKYHITAKVVGGGKNGQLEALVHGISRVLSESSPEKYRIILKKAGLLTRDSRERLRRMVGTGGKSRRKRQSPKR